MTDQLSARQFHESDGVGDWRALWGGGWACPFFRTGSFGAAITVLQRTGDWLTPTITPIVSRT
jgi:4a-hydroxytetrahydrobiopterin dehydratase